MFFGRNRVEEDLARIRHANLPDKYPPPEDRKARKARRKQQSPPKADQAGWKDILAMILAVASLILPYLLIFLSATVLFLWLWLG